jgi:hypothetical protein
LHALKHYFSWMCILLHIKKKQKQTPWPLVREQTIPTDRPPLVDEIITHTSLKFRKSKRVLGLMFRVCPVKLGMSLHTEINLHDWLKKWSN